MLNIWRMLLNKMYVRGNRHIKIKGEEGCLRDGFYALLNGRMHIVKLEWRTYKRMKNDRKKIKNDH